MNHKNNKWYAYLGTLTAPLGLVIIIIYFLFLEGEDKLFSILIGTATLMSCISSLSSYLYLFYLYLSKHIDVKTTETLYLVFSFFSITLVYLVLGFFSYRILFFQYLF